ncbi:MAG TPA: hypothetical protein VHZ97_06180 [Pseudonocardiaceae bacterium]|nr:hypothetical protein [Pseudonocardiaceae bacterium]
MIPILVGLAMVIFNGPIDRFNQAHGNTGGKPQSSYNRVVSVVIGSAFVVAGVLILIGVIAT